MRWKRVRFRLSFQQNEHFYRTPHQSATPTASPQGEAIAGAYLTDKSEFTISHPWQSNLSFIVMHFMRVDCEEVQIRIYRCAKCCVLQIPAAIAYQNRFATLIRMAETYSRRYA